MIPIPKPDRPAYKPPRESQHRSITMWCRLPALLLVVGLFLATTGQPALANVINIGSFETPVVTSPYQIFLPGSEPPGFSWRVTSGNVDITVNGAFGVFASFEGRQFLDLDGTVPGAIAQSFPTTPGNVYVLNFAYANNFGSGGTVPARATVRVFDTTNGANLIAPLSLIHSSSTAAAPQWAPSGAIQFVAQGTNTTLSFTSNNAGGAGGIFLDAVSVEPAVVVGPSITTSTVPTLQIGQLSSFKFDATLGQPPYTWSLASGTLPPGMALRSDGIVSGIATQAGQFTFSIKVQDSSGAVATSTFTLVVVGQAPGGLLVEDFEDGVLDPRISVRTTGAFSAGPGIKNVTNFGSTKAFGFGLSICGASCFFSFENTLRITFPVPEFVVSISFKEMELFSNWGSGGGVFIDGQPVSAECKLPACGTYGDFGRLPHDDLQPDTTFRSRSFPVNRAVTTIELRVNNISNRSEIYIDDLVVAGPPGLSITTNTVPTLQVGQPVSFSFNAALGQPPYAWSLISGTLPPGVILGSDGIVSGTPTQAGQFTFSVRVQDSLGMTATSTFALAVAPQASTRVYNLAANWSDGANPNSVWSYREGNNSLRHVDNWVSGGFVGMQPAWANAPSGFGHVPAWWKLVAPHGAGTLDAQIGDVLVHATDNARGETYGPSNVVWTSPSTSTVTINGSVWNALEDGRSTNWSLYLNDTMLTGGSVGSGDPFSRARPFDLAAGAAGPSALQNIGVRQGDRIRLEFVRTSAFGSTTGVNLTIAVLPVPFTFLDRGGVSLRSSGNSATTVVGYASIQPNSGSTTPSGLAIFGFRQNNILVTEASVPASALLQSGRIYAEVNGPVNTGLAMANPNAQPATVSFFFTGPNGNFGNGITTIPANGQIAKFLNEAPFNSGSSVSGALTFTSSVPIAVVALRGLTNERGDFLVTTLPVSDLSAPAASGTIILPQFADGGGWTTQIVLVNPGDAILSGTVQFLNPSGDPAAVAVNDQVNDTFVYSIPPRASQKFRTSGTATSTQSGSVRVMPAPGTMAPSGLGIFAFRSGGMTVTEAGVPAAPPGSAFRLYSEAAGTLLLPGSIQTGLAVANTSTSPATVILELHRLDGSSTGLTGTLSVPANGRVATFLSEIQGFTLLQKPFQGILRVSSPSSISVIGLRGRYNERNDFLITTTPATNESTLPSTASLFFPHFADSGGYTTQFVLFSGRAGQSSSGTMQLFSQSGSPLTLTFVGNASSSILYSQAPEFPGTYNSVTAQNTVQVFDNFSIPTGGTISSVTWQGLYVVNDAANYRPAPSPTATSFLVAFYADNAGSPGAFLSGATYPVATVNETLVANHDTFHLGGSPLGATTQAGIYSYSLNLAQNFFAGPGTRYWFSVRANTPNFDVFWGWNSSALGDNSSVQTPSNQSALIPRDRAFS